MIFYVNVERLSWTTMTRRKSYQLDIWSFRTNLFCLLRLRWRKRLKIVFFLTFSDLKTCMLTWRLRWKKSSERFPCSPLWVLNSEDYECWSHKSLPSSCSFHLTYFLFKPMQNELALQPLGGTEALKFSLTIRHVLLIKQTKVSAKKFLSKIHKLYILLYKSLEVNLSLFREEWREKLISKNKQKQISLSISYQQPHDVYEGLFWYVWHENQ